MEDIKKDQLSSNKSKKPTDGQLDEIDQVKKEKPPKIEDKPFEIFVNDHLIPGIKSSLEKSGVTNTKLNLRHDERPVTGGICWMIYGEMPLGRRFWLCFSENQLTSVKNFAIAEPGSQPSLLESFLIDERKITLPLLISRTIQRLNGQKWLGRN